MSRSDRDRLLDVLDAMAAIQQHLLRGPLDDGLIYDAVRVRLIEIGEAVKGLDAGLVAQQPQIPWRQVAAMRDQLAHRYVDTSPAVVAHTVTTDLPELKAAGAPAAPRRSQSLPKLNAAHGRAMMTSSFTPGGTEPSSCLGVQDSVRTHWEPQLPQANSGLSSYTSSVGPQLHLS